MEDLSEGTVKARKRLQNDTSHIVLNDVLKHVNRGGSKIIANKVKSNTLISCKPSLLVRLEAERVKSWIANQISGNLLFRVRKLKSYITLNYHVDSAEIPEVDSDDNASSKRVEETSETCENSTDVEEASSTASSSCSYYSKQNITRWRHLSKTKIELEEGGVLKKMDELGEGQGNLQSYQKPVRNLRRSGKGIGEIANCFVLPIFNFCSHSWSTLAFTYRINDAAKSDWNAAVKRRAVELSNSKRAIKYDKSILREISY